MADAKIAYFEEIMERYFRNDPMDALNNRCSEAVRRFNAWLEITTAELDNERAFIESKSSRRHEHEQVRRVKAFNERVGQYKREETRRRNEVEELQRASEKTFDAHKRWLEAGGLVQFSSNLNQFYASLHHETCRRQSTVESLSNIDRLKKIRNELGALIKARQENREDGLLIVPAILSGSETAWLIVDTGASSLSITPELVNVLGLEDRVGEEVEVRLAGGIRIKAPRITLPRVSVDNVEIEHIEAVVLKEPGPGIDGCLGMSFLSRVNYRIEDGMTQKLELGDEI